MKTHTSFRLPPDALELLREMAEVEDRSLANMLERAIREAAAARGIKRP